MRSSSCWLGSEVWVVQVTTPTEREAESGQLLDAVLPTFEPQY